MLRTHTLTCEVGGPLRSRRREEGRKGVGREEGQGIGTGLGRKKTKLGWDRRIWGEGVDRYLAYIHNRKYIDGTC